MITFKPATMDDAARLYCWRRDVETVAGSISVPPATFEAHCTWLEHQSHKADTDILIARDSSRSVTVGTVRLDFDAADMEAEISITVDPQQRGRGYAAEMLEAIISGGSRAETLVAHIKETNLTSLRLFWAAGFRGTVATHGVLRLERAWA